MLSPHQCLELWRQLRHQQLESRRLVKFANMAIQLAHGLRSHQLHSLEELELPTGPHNALRRAGYDHVEEICSLSHCELMQIGGIGEMYARWILKACRVHAQRRAENAQAQLWNQEPPAAAGLPHTPAERAEMLERAFYAWTGDRERMAALLLQAAELLSDPASISQLEALAGDLIGAKLAAAA